MSEEEILRIDVDNVLRTRAAKYYRFIPKILIRKLEKMICQREMNEFLEKNGTDRDAKMCSNLISHFEISYRVEGAEHLPATPRAIFSCNHPLGGLDGVIIIDYLSRRYNGKVKFVVNDLLLAIKPLRGVFLPINKHGRQNRGDANSLEEAMEGDDAIIIFPAGLVSRKGKNGEISDLEWQKSFINKAIKYKRDIIPMYFSGRNSKFFYNFAKWRTRLGLKFNIEMIRLPREMFLCRGKKFTLRIGKPEPWTNLQGGHHAREEANRMRERTYSLATADEGSK